jgi:hypothetical protein
MNYDIIVTLQEDLLQAPDGRILRRKIKVLNAMPMLDAAYIQLDLQRLHYIVEEGENEVLITDKGQYMPVSLEPVFASDKNKVDEYGVRTTDDSGIGEMESFWNMTDSQIRAIQVALNDHDIQFILHEENVTMGNRFQAILEIQIIQLHLKGMFN